MIARGSRFDTGEQWGAAHVPAIGLPAVLRPLIRRAADGRLVTSSLDVATRFEKEHRNVLRDIDALISQAPACALNFEPTSETVAMPRGGTREVRSYDMDRDGFSLLVMGFTGSKAIKFKLAYIAEFNAMEAGVA